VVHAFVVPTVASSIDVIVHTTTDPLGARRVSEIVGVPGRVEGDVVETTQIFQTAGGELVRADGYPPRPERFAQAGFDLPALLAQPDWTGAR
jgi:pilus assembly protein CpaF